MKTKVRKIVKFNEAELQSNLNRIKNAEALISQLPITHEGRNTWLLNYGVSEEANNRRKLKGINWDNKTQSAELIK